VRCLVDDLPPIIAMMIGGRHLIGVALVSLIFGGCGANQSSAATSRPANAQFRLALCSEAPVRLKGPAEVPQSRGCVARFTQEVSDPTWVNYLGANQIKRRYLVYAPTKLPADPVPVVFVFPGATANAEAAAFYYTNTRFETLADRDGFIVVYGNGLPKTSIPGMAAEVPEGGFLPACSAAHHGEGLDVTYVRKIVDQLETELKIDRRRIYATGLSMGGGMSFQLALEAPDLVAAIAPVAGVPYQPSGDWLSSCHPKPGYDKVSIAMLAATADPLISYAPGGSLTAPETRYPGMEPTRDAWLAAMQIKGAPTLDKFPDLVADDSYAPQSGVATSTVERFRYPLGPDGQELWYYKVEGMGHWWPNSVQIPDFLWPKMGKTNQDIDFSDEAWEFFQRHAKRD
jgi:polyhydroxybutyrate depolymerase